MIKMYTDAATKGNPGPTGLGVLVIDQHQQRQLTATVAHASNHEGEFLAAIQGFQYLLKHYDHQQTILYYTESRLLSDAIAKDYSKHYQNLLNQLNQLIDQEQMVVTQWIPEKDNHGAHHLANQALHQLE